MSENYQIAPWYNIKEWHEVYEDLYDVTSTLDTKQKALDYLLVWKARCPFMPSGVESTLTLLEVYLQDKTNLIQRDSDHIIRLAYSSALMRFVNHMLDSQTAKGQSLFQAAKTLNIPEWIIDMRHDTAHGNKLPPIELLREACMIGLEWLKSNYWDKHKEYIRDYIAGQVNLQRNERENKIEALINFCVSLSICSHPRCSVRTIADVPDDTLRESLVNDAKEILGDSFDYSNLNTITVKNLHHLLKHRVNKILYHDSAGTYVNNTLLSENSLFLSLELYDLLDTYNFNLKKLNKPFVQCFEMLLQFLHTYDLLQDFLMELIKKVQSSELFDRKRKLAALWVSVILKALRKIQLFQEQVMKKASKEETAKIKDIKSLFYHWFPNEKNCHLLLDLHKPVPKELTNINFIQPIISTYNEYLTCFIKDLLILVKPQLPQHIIDKLCELAKAISSPRNIETSSRIYTVDDLNIKSDTISNESIIVIDDQPNEIIEECQIVPNSNREYGQRYGVFQLASHNHDWSNCPMGLLPWQQAPTEQMDMDIN